MGDDNILCPLCKGEIPIGTEECNFCGAVLAPGPNRHTPILKGVVCKNCGERNYGYDYCTNCEQPFVIDCPECGSNLKLSDQKCESCGLSIRKFNKMRQREQAGKKPFPEIPKKYLMIGISAAAALLIILLLLSIFGGDDPDTGEKVEKVDNPRLIDKNQDGITDRWEHFNETGMVDWIKEDLDANGTPDKVTYLDSNQHKRKVVYDNNGDGKYEKIEFYRDDVPRMAVYHEGGDPDLITKFEIFSASGKLIDTLLDDNEDGVFEKHNQFDKEEKLYLEAFASKGRGYVDTFIYHNRQKETVMRGEDNDGDGIIEKRVYLSSKGNIMSEEIDEDGDGWPEKRTTYRLNGKKRMIYFDDNRDGRYERFESYTKEGKYARTGRDTDGDGHVDSWK